MLVLLPPSETKAAPVAGPPVSLESLTYQGLTEARVKVATALITVSSQKNALRVLGAGPSLAEEVARNARLWDNPADAAARVYTGVLYDAAAASAWDAATFARSAERLRIFSALWGVLTPADVIPAYRLSMATSLGRIGALVPFWRRHLAATIDQDVQGEFIVDCRSSTYAATWGLTPQNAVSVRVLRDSGGKRTVVSHNAKHARGRLVARLVSTAVAPGSAADLADLASEGIGSDWIELSLERGPRDHSVLTLVVA